RTGINVPATLEASEHTRDRVARGTAEALAQRFLKAAAGRAVRDNADAAAEAGDRFQRPLRVGEYVAEVRIDPWPGERALDDHRQAEPGHVELAALTVEGTDDARVEAHVDGPGAHVNASGAVHPHERAEQPEIVRPRDAAGNVEADGELGELGAVLLPFLVPGRHQGLQIADQLRHVDAAYGPVGEDDARLS